MMKKLILGLVALMALTFVACDENDDPTMMTVGFEDVQLDAAGLAQNDSISGSIESGALAVTCTWSSSDWGTFGSGFTVSNQTDTTNANWLNSFSCVAESGAENSAAYAVYYSSNDSLKFNTPVNMESIMLCNNAYAYVSMLKGDFFSAPYTTGDYFNLNLMLFDVEGSLLGSTDFKLADFTNGNEEIITQWTKLDLSTYKGVSYIKFAFDGSQSGTPTYFCLDNVSYYSAE